MAQVLISDAAVKQFGTLPTGMKPRVQELIDRLKNWPAVSGVKALAGNLAGHHRTRTGDYRVQFTVQKVRKEQTVKKTVKGREKAETVVTYDYTIRVEKVGHRDGFYE